MNPNVSKIKYRDVNTKINTKYNALYFKQQGELKFGKKYDYSGVVDEQIENAKSYVPLICNICGYDFEIQITNHINSKGNCASCSGNAKWTLKRFLIRGRNLYGTQFDYSKITENHIKNQRSYVPIKCTICGYAWDIMIDNHVSGKNGCPGCSNNVPWTLERVLTRGKELHGDKYDYSKVTENDIQGADSHIPVTCRICGYFWRPDIRNHLNAGTTCTRCSGHVPWNLEFFLIKAIEIHGEKYDYSDIVESDIEGQMSRVPVKCKKCEYKWKPSINAHINNKNGCASCFGNLKFTLISFIERARQIHGNKCDYSQIVESDIVNSQSHIPLKCNDCNYEWRPSISVHIHISLGCPRCNKRAWWTFEELYCTLIDIFGNLYNYSLLKPEHVVNADSRIPIICNICSYYWTPTINAHVNDETGCPLCKMSKGELECKRVLTELKIPFNIQFDPFNSGKRFDFILFYNNRYYLLEYDGEQHFYNIPHFHRGHRTVEFQKESDTKYSFEAIKLGYKVIRIDYEQKDNIRFHIINALTLELPCYLSSSTMYSHIMQYLQ